MAVISDPVGLEPLEVALRSVTYENLSADESDHISRAVVSLQKEIDDTTWPELSELIDVVQKLFTEKRFNSLVKRQREYALGIIKNWRTYLKAIASIFSSCGPSITVDDAKAIDDARKGLKARILLFRQGDLQNLTYCQALKSLFKATATHPPYYFHLTPSLQERAISFLNSWSESSLPNPADKKLGVGASAVVYQKGDLALKFFKSDDLRIVRKMRKIEVDAFRKIPPHEGFLHPICSIRKGIYFPRLSGEYTFFEPQLFKSHFDESQWKAIISKLLLSVAHLNSIGLKHGDLSFNNVFVSETGDIKIIDLGFARSLDVRKTGTAEFTAPETLLDYNDAIDYSKTDVFSVGSLLLYGLYSIKNFYMFGKSEFREPFYSILNQAYTIIERCKTFMFCKSFLLSNLSRHLNAEQMELATKLFNKSESHNLSNIFVNLMHIFYYYTNQAYIDGEVERVLDLKSEVFSTAFSEKLKKGLKAALKLDPAERPTALEVHEIIFGG
ncbi:MAG: protein kinase [Simkaniaceae bacterium]|nr:protein kinase [Simkaniaceae bacterium]